MIAIPVRDAAASGLLCDLDGVVRLWPAHIVATEEDAAGLPRGSIHGTAFAAGDDRTCRNWTSSTQGSAMVGHHDRMGLDEQPPAKSWNSSHASRGGCSQDALKTTGGAGLFYCFAVN